MRDILILNFFLMVFAVSLFGQDNSNVYTLNDLGLQNLCPDYYSLQLNYSNYNPDSIAAQNILWKPFDKNTIVVQALGGILFAAGGAAIGYLATPKSGDASGVGGGLAFVLGVTLTSIALPTGIYIGGNIMGGDGGLWYTLGGCIAGLAVGFLPNTLNVKKNVNVSAVLFGLCTVGGGIAGYNLSASTVYESSSTVYIKPRQEIRDQLQIKMSDFFNNNFNIIELSIAL